MKIALLSGSNVGSKTRTAMDYTVKIAHEKYPDAEITLLDLQNLKWSLATGAIIGTTRVTPSMLQKRSWPRMPLLLEHHVPSFYSSHTQKYF